MSDRLALVITVIALIGIGLTICQQLVAAMGAGRLSATEVTILTRAFLASDHAVRLVDRDTPAGRQRLPSACAR